MVGCIFCIVWFGNILEIHPITLNLLLAAEQFFLLFIALLELIIEFRKRFDSHMPPMSRQEIITSAADYAVIVIVFWCLMYLTQHVPGSEAAMKALSLQ